MEIINIIKVWWHCLWRMFSGHRIVMYKYYNNGLHWACTCGYCNNKQHGDKNY